jgi:ketosteroid isomerase-like protein
MTGNTLVEQVALLIDRAAISDTLIAFARAIDTKDWEGYAGLYTEDGVLELPFQEPDGTPAGHVGRPGLAEYVRGSLGKFTVTHHLSGNHQITLDGDTAMTVSYCQCIHRLDDDPENVWELGGWYLCRLRREADGQWRFAHVHLDSIWEHGSPVRS